MRIALLVPEFPGCGPSFGVGRNYCDLARGLSAAGHTVQVVAATDAGCFAGPADRMQRSNGPIARHLLLRPLQCRAWIDRTLAAFAPDVVDMPNWGGLGAFLANRTPRLVRLVTSAADPSHGRWGLRTPMRLATELLSVRSAAMVVADSAGMAAAGRRLYGRGADAITHFAYAGPLSGPSASRTPSVLFVGRLERRKGLDVLLEAWPRVRASRPEARLEIVGSDIGGYAGHVAAVAGATYHGWLDDEALGRLRANCLVQVVPSRWESFGNVALEAWAAGLAVVASATGGLPEVVGDAGALVPPGEASPLADAIIDALDVDMAGRMAAAGRERLVNRFLPERWITATLDQYAAIAQGSHG